MTLEPLEIYDEQTHGVLPVPTTEQITRIVCIALDTSGYSEYALHWAVENCLRPETDLVVLLHARTIPTVPGPFGAAYMDFTDYLERLEHFNKQESHSLLRAAGHYLKRHNIIWKGIALRGDAREEITRKVNEVHADVLIMGCRGLGMFKRTFLGSTSDYCIHHANCPVIIVKHPNPEELQRFAESMKESPALITPAATGH